MICEWVLRCLGKAQKESQGTVLVPLIQLPPGMVLGL